MTTNNHALSASDIPDDRAVAKFLKQQPDFFLRNRELIEELDIPHRTDGMTSLIEYQVTALRRHNRTLRGHLKQLTDIAEQNQSLSQRVHRLALNLFGKHDLEVAIDSIYQMLCTEFQAESIVLRLFVETGGEAAAPPRPELADTEVWRLFATQFAAGKPECGPLAPSLNDYLYGAQPEKGNVALLPLLPDLRFGVLVLAAADPERYRPGSGTMFLEELADIIGLALFHCLPPRP